MTVSMSKVELDQEQRAVVESDSSNILVVAGPGSGKTRVITERIRRLLRDGVAPSQIMVVTFTNAAANELRDRLEPSGRQMMIGTFHSLCLRILRDWDDRVRSVYDRYDATELLQAVMTECGWRGSQRAASEEIRRHRVLECAQLMSAAAHGAEPTRSELPRSYLAKLRQYYAVDYDQIIPWTLQLLAERPQVRAAYGQQLQHVFVDEAQDATAEQFEIIRMLERHNRVLVADPNQSIFSFLGATPENIYSFDGLGITPLIFKLCKSYRCRSVIARAVSQLIAHNDIPDALRGAIEATEIGGTVEHQNSEYEQQQYVAVAEGVQQTLSGAVATPSDCAILSRTNSEAEIMLSHLEALQIPAFISKPPEGLDRLSNRVMLAAMGLAVNPNDDFLYQRLIAQLLQPDIGIVHFNHQRSLAGESIYKFLDHWRSTGALADQLTKLNTMVYTWVEANKTRSAAEMFVLVWMDLGSHTKFVGESAKPHELLNDMERFCNAGLPPLHPDQPPPPPLVDFLDWMATRGFSERRGRGDGVAVLTMHSAKGLEFDHVWLLNVSAGRFPDKRSDIQEERRLCYVAASRARSRLTVCSVGRPSVFVEELMAVQWSNA